MNFKYIFSYGDSRDKKHKIINLFGFKISIKKYKNMKLGVAYNLFDGEELLEASLKSIRNAADFVCVVYQKTSYFGQPASENIENLLNSLKEKGLIDEIYLFEADFLNNPDKKFFEASKHNIGLELCKKAGMTHFLCMDVDEFYDSEQINKLKEFILKNEINSSACSIYEYLKTPEYKIENGYTFSPSNNYNFYVPFIMKIHKNKQQNHGTDFQTFVDTTRAVNGDDKFYLFPVQDVVMHHMCSVRKDLDKKYKNSTYMIGGQEVIAQIKKLQQDILNWKPEENRLGNSDYYTFDDKIVKKVENKFDIKLEE